MKKRFLFSLLAIFSAVIWFGGVSLAEDLAWDYIYDEASWNAAYNRSDSALKAYLDANPTEDLWNVTENRAANRNDKVCEFISYWDADWNTQYATWKVQATWATDDFSKVTVVENSIDGFVGQDYYVSVSAATPWNQLYRLAVDEQGNNYVDIWVKITSCGYTGSVQQSWSGAINAPGAAYPWAVLTLPKPFAWTIKFVYDGGSPVYPWWENAIVFNKWYAIASIPTELGNEYLLDVNGETTFDPNKLQISLEPIESIGTFNWNYIRNGETWNTAYNKTNSALKAYLDANPTEDLWNVTENRAANRNDKVCEFISYW